MGAADAPYRESRAAGGRVRLPRGVDDPLEVYVNGVPQIRGLDYRVEDGTLVFARPLAREGRLGWIRWLSMLLGVAGTYRRHESVDVIYAARDGRRTVATGLEPLADDP